MEEEPKDSLRSVIMELVAVGGAIVAITYVLGKWLRS